MPRDILAVPPVAADQRIPYGDDASQFLDLFLTKGKPRGAAAFIHGGFWRAKYDLTHASHLCAGLARAGIAVASLEYRRAGNGGGWPVTFDDLRHALTAARQHLPSHPVVLGHSAGGHLALRLASAPNLEMRAAIGLAPCADLQMAYDLHLSQDAVVEFLGGTPATAPQQYAAADARQHAASLPRILIHGAADDVVPIALSRSFMAARAKDSPQPELIELAAADHFALIDPESEAFKMVLSSVERLLDG
jgi:acetyl esterase/lipase